MTTDERVLSPDQMIAWETIQAKKNLFVTARAGAGKSFLIDYIKDNFNGKVLVTASTGIAANNVGGRTLHSQFLLNPFRIDVKDSIERVDSGKRGYAVRSAKLLIIDEISMVSDRLLDTIDEVCKAVRNSNLPFGGMQVAFFGDFLQLPPVFKGESANDKICWGCKSWSEAKVETLLLTSNFRQSGDETFFRVLTRLRYNKLTNLDIGALMARHLQADEHAIRLFALNAEVDRYNAYNYAKLDPRTEHFYFATSFGESSVINGFWKDSLVSQQVALRLGARVMMCKNRELDTHYLYNGSLGEVIGFAEDSDKSPIVKFDCGLIHTVESDVIFQLSEKDDRGNKVVLAEVSQVPLKLAYAQSVHKSQGQTFDRVMVDCSSNFIYGQAYVAFSRARSLDGLFIAGFSPHSKGSMSDPSIVARYMPMEQEAFERNGGAE